MHQNKHPISNSKIFSMSRASLCRFQQISCSYQSITHSPWLSSPRRKERKGKMPTAGDYSFTSHQDSKILAADISNWTSWLFSSHHYISTELPLSEHWTARWIRYWLAKVFSMFKFAVWDQWKSWCNTVCHSWCNTLKAMTIETVICSLACCVP